MGQIHILPDSLVNQIAAGEVIERPASVVKELLENALDAGAESIVVEVEDGGRKRICVSDDGSGMEPEDLALSVRPHATSKIRTRDDLARIATMGFRGEALASMGSVSRLRITSRPASRDAAAVIEVEGGRISPVRPAAGPVGTTVEVCQLFYNVPARRKFLKGAATEFGHIVEQVARSALVQPSVAFQLSHNARLVHRLPASQSLRERIAAFYGDDLAEALLEETVEERDVVLRVLVAPPSQSRTAGRWQYLFVNGRYVRDRSLQHALREAYRGLIEPTRYPVAFIYLRVLPEAVDVNVHPAKLEVRWRDASLMYSLVYATVRRVLQRHDLTAPLRTPVAAEGDHEARIREAVVSFFRRAAATRPAARADQGPAGGRAAGTWAEASGPVATGGPPAGESPAPPAPVHADVGPGAERVHAAETGGPVPGAPAAPARPRAMQLHNTYLVTETADGLLIIDQHALHERILYEELCERVARGPLESQRLLLPEVVAVPQAQVGLVESHADHLRHVGIEMTAYGQGRVAVHAFPTLLQRVEVASFVRDLLDRMESFGTAGSTEALTREVLQMMACKAAVKAGDPLCPEEIEALLERRELIHRASNCPHGRPTTLSLSLRDLEKQFHRT